MSSTTTQQDGIPSLKLNDGYSIPLLAYGLGTAQANAASEDVIRSTVAAIKAGFTHLDGAEVYGNETELGQAIKQSGVDRSKLFVTTKLDNKREYVGKVREAFDASMKRLDLEYVDLYLVHAPYMASSDAEIQSVWAEMEAIKASGRARSIGVSNFLPEHLEALLAKSTVTPAINQVEFHPYNQRTQIAELCRKNGIAISAYGPLTPITKASDGPLHEGGDSALLPSLATKYGVTPADVLLRWCIDQGVVAITTSANESRMAGYLSKIPSFKLTPEEVEEVTSKSSSKFLRLFWTANFAKGDTR